jgi:hypothetical protein
MRNKLCFLLPAAFLCGILFSGCGDNVTVVKRGVFANDSSVTYEKAFSAAFSDGKWSEVPGNNNEKLVQFTGKITPGLHEYAVGIFQKGKTRIKFGSACVFLSGLIKSGKVADDKGITFNIRDYPINSNGIIYFDRMGDFTDTADNKGKMDTLIGFYESRYFETGTPVLFQWGVYARGKVIKAITASNPNWDIDNGLANNPQNILGKVFGYAKESSK